MPVTSLIWSVVTVVSMFVFIGIVAWAYSGRRRARFEQDGLAPFALPDDLPVDDPHHGRRS